MPEDSLKALFLPRAVAVVGASRDPGAVGHKILKALIEGGFPGPIYPINPKAPRLEGRAAFSRLRDAPRPVDLAVVAVPADKVSSVVDDAIEAGVGALVVITAGFAETGPAGRALQDEILRKARAHGIRLVGPNCFGVLSTDPRAPVNACFTSVRALPGHVAMASQSGAMGLAILGMARRQGMGLSAFVSMGNKADVSSNDLVEYWEKDPRTKAILLYLESFGNPTRFATIARRVSKTKPLIALKSGRSGAGSRAAGSHTAALAASDVAVDALFRQCGVLRVETVEEMFQLAMTLETQPLPRGRRVGIVTNAGGPAILCADACEAGGLQVTELSPDTRAALRAFLPPAASVANPVDLIASATPEAYRRAVETVLGSPDIDALVVIQAVIDQEPPPGLFEAIAAGVRGGRRAAPEKPVLFCLMKDAAVEPPLDAGTERLPVFRFPEEPARVLHYLATYEEWKRRPHEAPVLPEPALAERLEPVLARHAPGAGGWLSADGAKALLTAAGLPTLAGVEAGNADEAARAAGDLGFPVALKLSSRKFTHKTEMGGVKLGLADGDAVRAAYAAIGESLARHAPGEKLEGVLVQPMAKKGIEIFVGMVRDPVFGPLIGFGLGGVLVEVLADIRFRVAPLSRFDAEELLREIKGHRILLGYRGMPAADTDALRELLLKVSSLSLAVPRLQSLDLNPVVAYPPGEGCLVLDARVQVEGTLQPTTKR